MLDLGKSPHRLAAFGTIVGIGTLCAADFACAGGAGVGLAMINEVFGKAVPGFFTSLLGAEFNDHLKRRLTEDDRTLRNHDLSRAVGDTVHEVILLAVRDRRRIPSIAQRRAARSIGREIRKTWPEILTTPGQIGLQESDLAGLLASNLPRLLRREDVLANPLSADDWAVLLHAFAIRAGVSTTISPESKAALSESLESAFARAFRERLKRDFEKGGRTYAAMHMEILGELLDAPQQTLDAVEGARVAVLEALGELAKTTESMALRRHRRLVDRMRALSMKLDELPASTAQELERVLGTLDLSPAAPLLRLQSIPGVLRHGQSIASRLLPGNREVPFTGREAELSRLQDWLVPRPGHDADVGIRVVTGPGGIGKTRLAIELCEQANGAGWNAGFAGSQSLRDLLKRSVGDWTWDQPTLLVVDHVGERLDDVRQLLDSLVERSWHASATPALRILLLERHGGPGMHWWDELLTPTAGTYGEWIQAWYQQSGDLHLESLVGNELIRLSFNGLANVDDESGEQLEAFAALCKASGEEQNPLLIQTAALLWTGLDSSTELKASEVYRMYVRREKRHLQAQLIAGGLKQHGPLIWRLVVRTTLTKGSACGRDQLREQIAEECGQLGVATCPPLDARRALITFLGESSHPDDDSIDRPQLSPLLPDRLGEAAFVSEWMGKNFESDHERLSWLSHACARRPAEACSFLSRCAQDHDEESAFLSLLGKWTESQLPSDETLEAFATALSFRSTALAGLFLSSARAHHRRLSASIEGIAGGQDREVYTEELARLARALGLLANASRQVGRLEDALASDQEALELHRRLAAADPSRYLPGLASSLNNISVGLMDLGRRDEALAAQEESVALCRRLADDRPEAFLPDLAMSLSNLGNGRRGAGQLDGALAAHEEALGIRRRLAAWRPESYLGDLAFSLGNLACSLSDLGRRKQALAVDREALGIMRRLAAVQPKTYQPSLAHGLSNLGVSLRQVGHIEEALAAQEEAVDLRRRLVEAGHETYLPGLAQSLSNLGLCLRDLGRFESALSAQQEALDLRRRLMAARPDAFLPDLARNLTNLGVSLRDLGRREEALAAAQESLGYFQKLARAFPRAFSSQLALPMSLVESLREENQRSQGSQDQG